jgi:thioredoxin-like negative regulator of GroEL
VQQQDAVMSANIVDVNAENWDAVVVQSALPVLVDFWAPCAARAMR